MEEAEEIWKPVRGYEGKYEVSSIGRVRSLNYNGSGKVKTLAFTGIRYCQVGLTVDSNSFFPHYCN